MTPMHLRNAPRWQTPLLLLLMAWALLAGRDHVLPEDVQAVLPSIACHRLRLATSAGHARAEDIAELIHATPIR